MQAFAQKPVSSGLARFNIAKPGQDHRERPIVHSQHILENRSLQRMLQPDVKEPEGRSIAAASRFGHDFSQIPVHPLVQATLPKLAVSKPGDKYEEESDRISQQVMQLPEPQIPCACGGVCPRCQMRQSEHRHERVHTKRVGSGDWKQTEVPPIVHEVLRSPGQPLDLATRTFMEPRFGHDFSQVRVHTDERAAMSAKTINAHAYAVGNDIVFGAGRFSFNTTQGRLLLAHELTHVLQQPAGGGPKTVFRQPADTSKLEQKDNPKSPPKPPKCDTGRALRWGQDTTCSKWGFFEGVHEQGEGKKWKSFNCCNSWPLSLENYARNQGLNGAASCKVQHEREIATIALADKEVQVLCSDTIPTDKSQVIEMSPKAMQDLSGQVANPLSVSVCYSGSKQELCLHNGPGAKSFPTVSQCLTKGCPIAEDTPTHANSGWPRV